MHPKIRCALVIAGCLGLAAPAQAQFGAYSWTLINPDNPNCFVSADTMYLVGTQIGFHSVDMWFEAIAPATGQFRVDVDSSVAGYGLGAFTYRNGLKEEICGVCVKTITLTVEAGDSFGFGIQSSDYIQAELILTKLRFTSAPIVTSVTPTLAYLEQDVVITGSQFNAGTTVEIDGVPEPVVSWTPTQLIVRPDAHPPGRFDLRVINGGSASFEVPDGMAFLPVLTASESHLAAPLTLTIESGAPGALFLLFGAKSLATPLPAGGAYYGLLVDPSQAFGIVPAGSAPANLVFALPDVPALAGAPFHCQALVLHGGSGIASSFTNSISGVLVYPSTQVLATLAKTQPAHADAFGARIARLGDTNGDGISELAISAPDSDEAGTAAGSVRIYSGSSGALLLTVFGAGPSANFGGAISSIRDFDGDGAPDLLVGSTGSGLVTVHSSVTGAVLASISTPNTAVAGLVDLDGDGVVEIGIGNGTFDTSSVRIHSGATGALLRQHTAPSSDSLGAALAALGDVDLDGVPDYGAGAPRNGCGSGALAYVRIYSGKTGAELATHAEDACSDLGSSLADAGDVDGDGYPDVIVGAPASTGLAFGPAQGFARVYSGRNGVILRQFSGELPVPSPTGTSPIPDRYGWSVASAGDVNGDGVPDLIVGSPSTDSGGVYTQSRGAIRVYSGAFGTVLYELKGAIGDWLGTAVVSLGDVNGDQLADFAAGASNAKVGTVSGGHVVVFSAVPP
jgi:hypothetical protein